MPYRIYKYSLKAVYAGVCHYQANAKLVSIIQCNVLLFFMLKAALHNYFAMCDIISCAKIPGLT